MTRGFLFGLYALRGQIDALIASTEEAMGVAQQVDAKACPECKASSDSVTTMTVFGGAQKCKCGECGKEWERLS